MRTLYIMTGGFLAALLLNLPMINALYGYGEGLARIISFKWGGTALGMIGTMFHEIGHTLLSWFYGYPAVPAFDFIHGGGVSLQLGDQSYIIFAVFQLLLLAGIVNFRGQLRNQFLLAAVMVFGLLTAFDPVHHEVVVVAAGHIAEIGVAAFFLFRAWMDFAPFGMAERVLNAVIGWGLILQSLLFDWGLLRLPELREIYARQKGGDGFGDFDRLADLTMTPFNTVVWFFIALAFLGALVPLVIYTLVRMRLGLRGGMLQRIMP